MHASAHPPCGDGDGGVGSALEATARTCFSHSKITGLVLKIAHLITGLVAGGAETMLLRLVSKMDRSRFENAVFSIKGEDKLAQPIRDSGTPLYCGGLNPSFPNPLLLYKLIQRIRVFRPDIIQTWLYHADFLGSMVGKLGVNAPVIWNLRCSELGPDDASWSLRRLISLLSRWSSNIPTVVIVNSKSGKAFHEAIGYRPARWEIIPNGFDMSQYSSNDAARLSARNRMGIDSSTPLIGLVGRYVPMKDHGLFLKAASILAKTIPDCRFALVGKGSDKNNSELMERIKSLGLENSISLIGEQLNIAGIMAGFDVGALTSNSGEGFPNVVAEMMACKVPCVVTDVGDAAEIVGDSGAVVARGDAVALAREWAKLLTLPKDERIKLGEGARERIGTQYPIERAVAQYERLYETVAAYRGDSGFRT